MVLVEMVDAEVAVYVAGRDEEVMPGSALEELRRSPHDSGHVAGGIDDRVPLPALEDVEPAVPIADQFLDLGEQTRIGPTSIEQGRHVTARQRGLDHVGADEAGASDEEDPECLLSGETGPA